MQDCQLDLKTSSASVCSWGRPQRREFSAFKLRPVARDREQPARAGRDSDQA